MYGYERFGGNKWLLESHIIYADELLNVSVDETYEPEIEKEFSLIFSIN